MKRRVLVRACSLALLSAASAAAWRAEVEWHGWGGLGWLRYTHLAVPIARRPTPPSSDLSSTRSSR